jgi:D-ribose pyranase
MQSRGARAERGGIPAMKKTTLLHRELSAAVAGLGHTDRILFADAGHPIPRDADRIDLAVRPGLPAMLDVLGAVVTELSVEAWIVSAEMEAANPDLWAAYPDLLGSAERIVVPHAAFKELVPGVKTAVRTGEYSPFANIILVAGVAGITHP